MPEAECRRRPADCAPVTVLAMLPGQGDFHGGWSRRRALTTPPVKLHPGESCLLRDREQQDREALGGLSLIPTQASKSCALGRPRRAACWGCLKLCRSLSAYAGPSSCSTLNAEVTGRRGGRRPSRAVQSPTQKPGAAAALRAVAGVVPGPDGSWRRESSQRRPRRQNGVGGGIARLAQGKSGTIATHKRTHKRKEKTSIYASEAPDQSHPHPQPSPNGGPSIRS